MERSHWLVVAGDEDKSAIDHMFRAQPRIAEYDLPEPKLYIGADEPLHVDGLFVENCYRTPQAVISTMQYIPQPKWLD